MTDTPKIMIIEDDLSLARSLRNALLAIYPSVTVVFNDSDALRELSLQAPDFLLADCETLSESPEVFCRKLRGITPAPLILYSSNAPMTERVHSLEAGADDYLAKPLITRELLAKINAIWRRYLMLPPEPGKKVLPEKLVEYPGLSISLTNYTVSCDEEPVEMPPKELELLYFLAESPNQVFTREQLLDQLWGYDYIGDVRTVDVHIKRIREKIKDHETWSLDTVWGVGYKFSFHPSYNSSDDR